MECLVFARSETEESSPRRFVCTAITSLSQVWSEQTGVAVSGTAYNSCIKVDIKGVVRSSDKRLRVVPRQNH